jgi:16S rRNA (adenine1518-N6/adenine1519-N6)-dimethyltransferase
LNLYNETKFILKKYGLIASKRLGQNFLINEEAISKTVEVSNITKEDLVIEIGPGLGTLTELLLNKAGKVISIELDERMIQILNDRFSMYKNFKLINEDILKVDLEKLIQDEINKDLKRVKIVANLPYYITTPIIMKLLEDELNIESITVMVQKEVADRLTAIPGEENSGAITYAIRYYSIPKKIMDVPNTSFMPSPEVNSSIIKLDILKEPAIYVENEKLFFKIIKLAFMQKRKTLVNALANGGLLNNKCDVEKMIQELGLDTKIRGEKLTLEDFRNITNYCGQLTK